MVNILNKFVENIKTDFVFSNFFPKTVPVKRKRGVMR
jgi:hypothetical protein